MSIDKNRMCIYNRDYIAPVIPELNTCDKIQLYITKLTVDQPLQIEIPEQFQNETLPYSTEYCDWMIHMIKREINMYRSEIKLLEENIIHKKIPGEIRKAQRHIKYLREQMSIISSRASRFYNGAMYE
jgi:hypothetical protein